MYSRALICFVLFHSYEIIMFFDKAYTDHNESNSLIWIKVSIKKIKTKPIFIAIIIFSVTMTIGVLWEINEFSFDSFAGGNMQRAKNLCPETGYCDSRLGLMDTMKDFMLNGIGAIFASVLGYIYIKKGEQFLLNGMIKRFIENNPKLFYK